MPSDTTWINNDNIALSGQHDYGAVHDKWKLHYKKGGKFIIRPFRYLCHQQIPSKIFWKSVIWDGQEWSRTNIYSKRDMKLFIAVLTLLQKIVFLWTIYLHVRSFISIQHVAVYLNVSRWCLNHWKAALRLNYTQCTTFQFLLAGKSVLVHHKKRYINSLLESNIHWMKNYIKHLETEVKIQISLMA